MVNDTNIAEESSVTPLCCNFTNVRLPIFQCECGLLVACSSCRTKITKKCTACTLPIGNDRCGRMERMVETCTRLCANSLHGCDKRFSRNEYALDHFKECSFALCCCPAPECSYMGVYNDLNTHFNANHKDTSNQFRFINSIHKDTSNQFKFIYSILVRVNKIEKISVIQMERDGPLVAVQCFKEPEGLYITVNCMAPSAPGVGELSFDLSFSTAGNTMAFGSWKMNKIQDVSFQTPDKDFMLVPNYFMSQNPKAKIKICIRKRK